MATCQPAPSDGAPAAPPPLPSNDYLQSLEPAAASPASTAARDAQDVGRLVGVCVAVGGLALATELNKEWIGSHQVGQRRRVYLGRGGWWREEGRKGRGQG